MIDILIRYLGIKTKILPYIKKAVSEITSPNEGVLDLFAGSNSVAQFLMTDYPVYTNDYQKYSFIAAKALIEYHSPEVIRNISAEVLFGKYFKENNDKLLTIFNAPVQREAELLGKIKDKYYGKSFDEFTEFFNNSPYKGNIQNKEKSFNNCLNFFTEEYLSNYKKDNTIKPFCLFTTYYNNPYFSLRQCIDIDSMIYSIHSLLKDGAITDEEFNIYLSCIIYSLNLVVISVGDHFAQPQKIKPVSANLDDSRDSIYLRERKKIITKKRTDITDLVKSKISEFKISYIPGNENNKAFNMNALELLQTINLKNYKIKTVYIDPPYTNAHYSRFYHILETLVLYDYPKIEYFGRYRSDRYQSPFCIKTQAYNEFKQMIDLCHSQKLNTVISYSNTEQCILKINDLLNICSSIYGNNVKVENVNHMYRNFGQKPNKIFAKEFLISCISDGN